MSREHGHEGKERVTRETRQRVALALGDRQLARAKFCSHNALATMSKRALSLIEAHQQNLVACTRCENMFRPPIVCGPLTSKVLLVGQAPGDKEPLLGRPFAWTAGKQLFKWFLPLGLSEAEFRARVYMAAVCRCFPGKNPKGGDRVPSPEEVANCRPWLEREIELLKPELILPVGRVAIEQFLPARPLVEQIGTLHVVKIARTAIDVIPLPHPSGASTWPRSEPGKTLTQRALDRIAKHRAWRALLA
ncbi:MAG TPA: uracil-DNA glycosylase family protein [Polyangiaceae bacterium]|jgi:uracil-DNA glycosylase|nr:uracil-DNA glycosylase family protein [Polyangiaceae bacterium]